MVGVHVLIGIGEGVITFLAVGAILAWVGATSSLTNSPPSAVALEKGVDR